MEELVSELLIDVRFPLPGKPPVKRGFGPLKELTLVPLNVMETLPYTSDNTYRLLKAIGNEHVLLIVTFCTLHYLWMLTCTYTHLHYYFPPSSLSLPLFFPFLFSLSLSFLILSLTPSFLLFPSSPSCPSLFSLSPGVHGLLQIFSLILADGKLLFISSSITAITSAIISVVSLMYPMGIE